MNNFDSLPFFIPEIILIFNVFLLLLFSDLRRKNILFLLRVVILLNLTIACLVNLAYMPGMPLGLFFNNFARDPFAGLFSSILLGLFLILNIDKLRRLEERINIDCLINELICLTASILLVKANSMTAFFLCVGLIFISYITHYYVFNRKIADNYAILVIQALIFGLLFFVFWFIYGLFGSLYFNSINPASALLRHHPAADCYIILLLTLGFGLYGIVLPFYFLHRGKEILIEFRNSTYFIALMALFGSLIRLSYRLFSEQSNAVEVSRLIGLFSACLMVCLMIGANLYYLKKKTAANLIITALIIHYSMTIIAIIADTADTVSAAIYLMLSSVLIFAGIASLPDNENTTILKKVLLTIFYLGLIGLPGTSGFIARFLLIKSLIDSGISLWIITCALLFSLPLTFYFMREIINLQKKRIIQVNTRQLYCMPTLLALFTILSGIFWEPLFELITESIVFFK